MTPRIAYGITGSSRALYIFDGRFGPSASSVDAGLPDGADCLDLRAAANFSCQAAHSAFHFASSKFLVDLSHFLRSASYFGLPSNRSRRIHASHVELPHESSMSPTGTPNCSCNSR